MKDPKKIVIVGGEFNNKGAEAMTFVTVSEIKRLFKETEVVMANHLPYHSEDVKNLQFKVIHLTEEARLYTLGIKQKMYAVLKWIAKSILRGHQYSLTVYAKELKDADYILDISGYVLSSQMGVRRSNMYLNRIKAAEKYRCKYVIMPQSIGPFDYNGEIETQEIVKILSKVQLIFAREREGYELLKGLGLNNVVHSNDLVLQAKSIEQGHVFKEPYSGEDIEVEPNSVAIIPNIRNIQHSNEEKTIHLYGTAIEELQKLNKNIYLISHCKEDMELINKIHELYSSATVIQRELNCIEYEDIIKKFDYVIASRYHSIIHAYKEHIPCIVIGWALKYQELVTIFQQQDYIFDIRENCDGISEAVRMLNKNYKSEAEKIGIILEGIQKNSCFDILKNSIED